MVDPVYLEAPHPAADAYRLGGLRRARRDELVTRHRHLCGRGARKFARSGVDRADLEQIAAVGLVKAADRYDAAAATPFEAYAWVMVVGELMHHIRDHERLVRVPRGLQSLDRRFMRAHESLVGRLGREPSDGELATEIGVVVAVIAELRRARESAHVVPILEASATAQRPAGLDADERIRLDDAFGALGALERKVIAGVYLVGLTQLEVARRLGVSAKSVSRLHRSALDRMARSLGG